jgi:hypothetical protein
LVFRQTGNSLPGCSAAKNRLDRLVLTYQVSSIPLDTRAAKMTLNGTVIAHHFLAEWRQQGVLLWQSHAASLPQKNMFTATATIG